MALTTGSTRTQSNDPFRPPFHVMITHSWPIAGTQLLNGRIERSIPARQSIVAQSFHVIAAIPSSMLKGAVESGRSKFLLLVNVAGELTERMFELLTVSVPEAVVTFPPDI